MSDDKAQDKKDLSDERDMFELIMTGLKKHRDELALQIHLGKEEAKEEWEKVEDKFHVLGKNYEPVKEAVEESAGNVFASLKLMAGEIKKSFDRIRESIVDEDDKK